MTVNENGRSRRMSALEVIFRRLANDAMRGEATAIKLLLSLADRYVDTSKQSGPIKELLDEDYAILARYLRDPVEPTSDTEVGNEK